MSRVRAGFNLTEEKTHHVEHVNRRLVKKAAGDCRIAGPDWIQQFATVHLHVRRVGRMRFGDELFERGVDGSEAAVVSDLEHGLELLGFGEVAITLSTP